MWKEKHIVTLISNQAFDFINYVCLPVRLPWEELPFFFYVRDVMR